MFTQEQEEALSTYILNAQTNLQGLSSFQVRRLAYDFAIKLGIPHPFNQKKKLAGETWMSRFMHRWGLSNRKAQHTSTARAYGFNKDAVEKFFNLLEKIKKEKNIKPENIYNVDETGVTVNPKSTSRIIARQGIKQVGGLTAAERGRTVTAELSMSATGKFMPPMLIFPLVNRNPEYEAGKPPGAWAEYSRNGWINEELFTKWFKEFIKFSKPTKEEPVLLLLDGHSSHVKNLEVIDLALDNNVVILCFPPHCTHRLQPLDVVLMRAISTYYNEVVSDFQKIGRKVTMKDIFYLFGLAWEKASKEETAKNGFKKTGIEPFDRNVFKDSDFAILKKISSNSSSGIIF